MSKPAFADLLRLKGRRNRKSYVQINLVLIAILMLAPMPAMHMMTEIDAQQMEAVQDVWELPAMVYLDVSSYVVGVPSIILMIIALAQRCRDIGWSGWWALLLPVPMKAFLLGDYVLRSSSVAITARINSVRTRWSRTCGSRPDKPPSYAALRSRTGMRLSRSPSSRLRLSSS